MSTKAVVPEQKDHICQLENFLFEDTTAKVEPLTFLDYFPMIDWMTSLQLLNQKFRTLVDQKYKKTIKLDLSPLWSTIDVEFEFIPDIIKLIKRFPIANDVSLAYCNLITDDLLIKLLAALPANPEDIHYLNLFYNNRLTDSSIKWICESFPNLKHLNIGRCMHLTGKSIDRISSLQHLQKLSLLSTEFDLADMMSLEENGCLERLKELDVRGCKKLTKEKMETLGSSGLKVHSGKIGNKVW